MAQPTAEGVELDSGTGGSTVAVETVGGKVYPAGMVVFSDGASGVTWVEAANGLPVAPETSSVWQVQSNAANLATQATLAAVLVDTGQIETLLTAIDADTSRIPARGDGAKAEGSRVTLATDDEHFGIMGSTVKNADGPVHAQLHYIADAFGEIGDAADDDGTIHAQLHSLNDFCSPIVTINTSCALIKTAVEKIDNAIFVDDAAFTLGTSSGVMMMGFAGAQEVHANDAAALACTVNGALYIQEAAALDVSAQTVTVDCNSSNVTLAGNLPDTASSDLLSINSNTSTIQGDCTVIASAVYNGETTMSRHAAVGAMYDDDQPGTVAEGKTHSLRMSSERYLYTEIRDAAGNERGMVVDANGYITTNLSQLGGSAINMGEGVIGGVGTGGTQRVTLATDDDGVAHLDTINTNTTTMAGWTCDTSAVVISSGTVDTVTTVAAVTAITNDVTVVNGGTFAVQDSTATYDTSTYNAGTTSGSIAGAVRNNDLASLVNADNDVAPLQVDENGALYVTQGATAEVCASGVATDGTTAIVAALAGHYCRIHALVLKSTSATVTNVYLATTTDTDVMGNVGNPMPLAIDADGDNDSGIVLPYNPKGWTTTTTANEALNLILSAAQDVIWMITYSYIPV